MDEREVELDELQQKAVELFEPADKTGRAIAAITGGAGTGKTTTLRYGLQYAKDNGFRVALAAPTGKAARRAREATGWPASTIHRLLEWRGDDFARNATNPLDLDLLVVDEASMVDTLLMAAIVRALRRGSRLLLVGDANQLPSVAPGRVFADIIESGVVPVVRLQTVHRAAAETWVCRNAPLILEGREPELDPLPDFRFHEAETVDDVIYVLRMAVSDGSPMTGEAQIFSPQNKGDIGIRVLNPILQRDLNPRAGLGQGFKVGADQEVYENDLVIQTRNDYELGVMNGEVGRVLYVGKKAIDVDFGPLDGESEVRSVGRSSAYALQLAYALTVHRGQGSQWPWAIVVCHDMHRFMLSRQLLYTAVTRARKGVMLVGTRDGLQSALLNDSPAQRVTRLRERLQAAEVCYA